MEREPTDTITLADLRPDPQNARRHTPRNVGMIVEALHEVGAARSIVIDEEGVVLAGNATVDAAGEAGVTRVRVVEATGDELVAVRRRGLTPAQKRRLALYDNRTAELATWDPDVLRDLAEPDLHGLFTVDELVKVLGTVPPPTAFPAVNDLIETGTGRCPRCQFEAELRYFVRPAAPSAETPEPSAGAPEPSDDQ